MASLCHHDGLRFIIPNNMVQQQAFSLLKDQPVTTSHFPKYGVNSIFCEYFSPARGYRGKEIIRQFTERFEG